MQIKQASAINSSLVAIIKVSAVKVIQMCNHTAVTGHALQQSDGKA